VLVGVKNGKNDEVAQEEEKTGVIEENKEANNDIYSGLKDNQASELLNEVHLMEISEKLEAESLVFAVELS
jgi:hypothetical protein